MFPRGKKHEPRKWEAAFRFRAEDHIHYHDEYGKLKHGETHAKTGGDASGHHFISERFMSERSRMSHPALEVLSSYPALRFQLVLHPPYAEFFPFCAGSLPLTRTWLSVIAITNKQQLEACDLKCKRLGEEECKGKKGCTWLQGSGTCKVFQHAHERK